MSAASVPNRGTSPARAKPSLRGWQPVAGGGDGLRRLRREYIASFAATSTFRFSESGGPQPPPAAISTFRLARVCRTAASSFGNLYFPTRQSRAGRSLPPRRDAQRLLSAASTLRVGEFPRRLRPSKTKQLRSKYSATVCKQSAPAPTHKQKQKRPRSAPESALPSNINPS